VPFDTATNGLDYNAVRQDPARGVVVQAVDASGTVLDSDVTDDSGAYEVTVDSETNVRIRAQAALVSTSGAVWDVRVRDNTNSDSLYALGGSLTTSGVADSTRNLNAGSGWGGASYTTTRAAAPFAILDGIYEALTDFAAVDPTINAPDLQVFWSTQNRAASGTVANGEIGTSSYTQIGGVPTVLVLGDANNDTDEYDIHVIVHEFGHYFEDQLSRSDSTGGSHSLNNRLDPRIALGEGFGNALSGIILDDSFYRDSGGASQASGFAIDVESNTYSSSGWYASGSVQSILYDIYDATDDGADTISAGLAPIYNALTDPAYRGNVNFTTIFQLIDQIGQDAAIPAADLTALVTAQNINGTGPTGVGETNDGSIANVLPVYKVATIGGPAVQVCSTDNAGTFNKLGVRDFVSLNVPTAQSLTFTMTKTSGDAARDPDFRIFSAGAVVDGGISGVVDSETATISLAAGDYTIEALDDRNLSTANSGDACYDFSVQ
jgi:hypothetical protein